MRLSAFVVLCPLLCCACTNFDRVHTWKPKKGDAIQDVRNKLAELNIQYEESALYNNSRGDIVYKIGNVKYRITYTYVAMIVESEPRIYDPLIGLRR